MITVAFGRDVQHDPQLNGPSFECPLPHAGE